MRSPASEISRIRPLTLKRAESSGDIAFSKRLQGGFECRIFLTNDFIKMRSPHPYLLELLEWPASLDALVLACIADQEHSVLRPKTAKEFSDLVRACEARFVHEVEMPTFRGLAVGPTGEESLQRCRFDAGLSKLPRGGIVFIQAFAEVIGDHFGACTQAAGSNCIVASRKTIPSRAYHQVASGLDMISLTLSSSNSGSMGRRNEETKKRKD